MNKDLIKEYLNATFLVEETIPTGLKSTKAIQKDDADINKEAMKDVEEKMEEYLDGITGEKENEEVVKKYNYDDEQKGAHERGELPNGSMAVLDVKGNTEEWDKRQEKAIKGDSTMGNAKTGDEVANVIPGDQAGFKGPEGDEETYDNSQNFKEKSIAATKAVDSRLATSVDSDTMDTYLNLDKDEKKSKKVNEGMKRLVFNKEFNGVENALKLIPESYRVDNKTFQMTDGNENYEIRWEGDINEGRAIVIKASDKELMNEDMQKMKHLMGFKSQETLGNLKGSERINEDDSFNNIWNKTKDLLKESNKKTEE